MIYILNTEISDKKPIKIALQNIFGVGKAKSIQICTHLGISEKTSIKFLTSEMKNKIVLYIENEIEIGDDLRKTLTQLKENQVRLKCYKGQRAKFKLPRRGQRTHTNAKTTKNVYR
jgi:small subunit ribosomal protein S13